MRTDVTFQSAGADCAGTFYWPSDDRPRPPCVVLCHGFSGTKDWVLPDYAERFAAAGLAAFAFDYRHFGESGGEPRQLVSVSRQREDIRAAIRCVRGEQRVDGRRIALWGTSLGGGHVIAIAAEDPDLAAVVAQVPGIDMVRKEARATIHVPLTVKAKLVIAGIRDAIGGVLGLPPHYADVYGPPGSRAIFTDPALRPRIEAAMAGSPTWRNHFAARFILAPPRYRQGSAEKIAVPLLVCVADRDVYANPAFQAEVGRRAPRGEVRHYPGEHFDFYHALLEQVARDQIDFLHRHLDGDRQQKDELQQTGPAARS